MTNRLCTLLGIDTPIVQAPMGGASCPALAAAVSNAGGLGMLAVSWHTPEGLRADIRKTQALTSRPFGINLVLEWPQDERLAICLEEKVPVISIFWGEAAPFVARVHAAGSLLLQTVSSAAEAVSAARAGVDAVVAQGWEAGGHVKGDVATLPLVRTVVRAVPGTPVIAAGGIADGAGLAAVLALGASGAWIGTRFLAAEEAAIHPDYRARLLAASETDTLHSELFDVGWPNAPHRTLRNTTIAAWEKAGRPAIGARPGEGETVATGPRGPIARYTSGTPTPATTGDIEALSLWSGQGVGLVSRVQPAGDIVREITAEAKAALAAAKL